MSSSFPILDLQLLPKFEVKKNLPGLKPRNIGKCLAVYFNLIQLFNSLYIKRKESHIFFFVGKQRDKVGPSSLLKKVA